MKPIIMTDASCDMPEKYIKEKNIPFLGLICHFKEREYEDDFGKSLSYKEFYSGLQKGEMPYTSQINEYRFLEKFKVLLKEKRPIIYIGLDSAISGTFNSSKMAKNEILVEFKDADITLIDSKSASLGQGILVYHAVEMSEAGCTKEEIVSWVENNKTKINHWFAVEDLIHLKRGGRISSSKAIVGTLLNVKPIIFMDENGVLKNVANIRGKKRAFKYLVDRFREMSESNEKQVIGISHGDCIEDAMDLKALMEKEFPNNKYIVSNLGLGMGTHCGKGMVSLCFMGKNRNL